MSRIFHRLFHAVWSISVASSQSRRRTELERLSDAMAKSVAAYHCVQATGYLRAMCLGRPPIDLCFEQIFYPFFGFPKKLWKKTGKHSIITKQHSISFNIICHIIGHIIEYHIITHKNQNSLNHSIIEYFRFHYLFFLRPDVTELGMMGWDDLGVAFHQDNSGGWITTRTIRM